MEGRGGEGGREGRTVSVWVRGEGRRRGRKSTYGGG